MNPLDVLMLVVVCFLVGFTGGIFVHIIKMAIKNRREE
jgi:uncharacterized protein YneF (UPF0154 family)